jgi:hypothetical protein
MEVLTQLTARTAQQGITVKEYSDLEAPHQVSAKKVIIVQADQVIQDQFHAQRAPSDHLKVEKI